MRKDHKHILFPDTDRVPTNPFTGQLDVVRINDLLDELRELRVAEPSMYKGMGITKAIKVVERWAERGAKP